MESLWSRSADRSRRLPPTTYRDEDPQMPTLLRELLAGPALSAAYQPIVDLRTRRVHGFEALVRARTPDGEIPPVTLVEAATRHGLIDQLTVRVADEALSTISTAVMMTGQPLRLALNVELEQLHPDNLVVAWLMRRASLPGVRLILEITERGADLWTTENEAAAALLETAGVELALDDFGTGSARLGFLHHRHWDVVKLDRQFLVYDTPRDRVVLRHYVQMLRELRLPMLVEGIETEAQFRLARELGVEYAQGFWLGRPLDAATLLERVRRDGLALDPGRWTAQTASGAI